MAQIKLELVEHVMSIGANETICLEDQYEVGCYKMIRERYQYKSGHTYESFGFVTDKEYAPQIVYRRRDDIKFQIQTTAYGSKPISEIEKIIAGYQEAVRVVKAVTREFAPDQWEKMIAEEMKSEMEKVLEQ